MAADLDALRARAFDGEELLRAAVRLNDIESLSVLAAQVTPEDWRAGWQRTLIPRARTAEALRTLIDCGAIIDAVDDHGEDALDHALETFDRRFEAEESRFCDLLLSFGMPVERNGGDRLRTVAERLNPGAAAWLLKRSQPVSPDLLNQCLNVVAEEVHCSGDFKMPEIRELLRLLVANGANPNAPDALGYLPLYHAGFGSAWLENHSVEVLEDLLLLGADPLARGREGWTALDMLLYEAAPGWTDQLFVEQDSIERITWAERFIEECPNSKFVPAFRILTDATRRRLQP